MLKGLYEVTVYRRTCVMCDSEYIVDCCNLWAKQWHYNTWCTAAGPLAHAKLRKFFFILVESYGTLVTMYHVPSHAERTENERVDDMARQRRLRSSLWTANKLLLTVHEQREREEAGLHLHIVAVRESRPLPEPDDFVPCTPESVQSKAGCSVIVCPPDVTRPSNRVLSNLDTPLPHRSQAFTDFEVLWVACATCVYQLNALYIHEHQ